MTTGLLLVGASGLAREIRAAGLTGVTGILDDNADLLGTDVAGAPVVGAIIDAVAREESLLACVGESMVRREIVRRLAALGVSEDRFATFIAESARVGRTSTVGAGSVLLDAVVVTADVRIGRHVVVMPHCTITHDCVIEDFVTMAGGVTLGGSTRILEAAYIGMNASIRQGVVIGAGSTVGMGAAVLEDVPAGEIWAGVPARRLAVTP